MAEREGFGTLRSESALQLGENTLPMMLWLPRLPCHLVRYCPMAIDNSVRMASPSGIFASMVLVRTDACHRPLSFKNLAFAGRWCRERYAKRVLGANRSLYRHAASKFIPMTGDAQFVTQPGRTDPSGWTRAPTLRGAPASPCIKGGACDNIPIFTRSTKVLRADFASFRSCTFI
jgi:hypothetical protein